MISGYSVPLEIFNLGYIALDIPRLDRVMKVKQILQKYSKISCRRVMSSKPS